MTKDQEAKVKTIDAEIAKIAEQVERDKAARNKAEKDIRDGEKRIAALKEQKIGVLMG